MGNAKHHCQHIVNISILCCFLILIAVPSIAIAAQNKAITAQYNVYAGGIHAVEAELLLQQESSKYSAKLATATRGLLGNLAPWSGVFETKGVVRKNNKSPIKHTATAKWREDVETKTYQYQSNGAFKAFQNIEEGKDKTPEKIDPALTQNTIDVLTATWREMDRITAGKSCGGMSEIFDGERRFKLVFKTTGQEKLKANDYNIYQGSATVCTAEVEPKGGKWHKKPRGWMSIQEQGRAKGSLPTIWFATIDSPTGLKITIPVKLRVKTDYGTLFMHLTRLSF